MSPEQFKLLNGLFHEVLEKTPAEREGFITTACGGDEELDAALRRLLAADEQATPMARAQEEIWRVVTARMAGEGESPGDRIDRYLLKEQIGEGGFGVVYLAEQQSPVRRDVALKVIKLGMDTRQVISRFEAERQALAMMTHPGIATVLDAGATPTGRPYFVMELVRGAPITAHADLACLDTRRRLELFVEVCDAIQHAHQKGIIHRDLKPSNILVAASDGGASFAPKIIDFGIAKATGARLTDATIQTEARQFIGTPEYMSPEQTGGPRCDIDTRSDIYSLGVVLYELLTGFTPFDSRILRSESELELLRVVREIPPPRPSSRVGRARSVADMAMPEPDAMERIARARGATPVSLRRQLRGDLDWIILKCLEKDRDRRYHTVHDLALDVGRHLGNQPVVARPPSVPYRLRKFARRHRVPLVAALLVLSALVTGLGLATFGLVRARQQRNMAITALTFVEEVIAAPDPNRGNPAGITVAESLDLASQRLNAGVLGKQLEVEARIRRMLGSTYMAMGLYDKGAPELSRSLELSQRIFGIASSNAGAAWNDLGELHRLRGDLVLADEAYTKAMEIQSRLPSTVSTAQTFNNLALLRQLQGEFEEAVGLQRRALDLRLSLLGADDPEVATSYNNLGALALSMGDHVAAEEYYRQALDMRLRLLNPGHWRVASTQLNLARALVERGDYAQAETLATSALASSRRALGDAHTQVGRAAFCLGVVYQGQHRYVEAEEMLRSSVKTQRAAMPAGHLEIAFSLTGLGGLLMETRRFEEAETVLREAFEIRRSKLSPDHPLVGVALSMLGEAALGQGNVAEAEQLLVDGHQVIDASKYMARSQRRDAARRLADLAHSKGDADAETRWSQEARGFEPSDGDAGRAP